MTLFHTGLLQVQGQKPRLEEAEGLDCCQVGGPLHYDAVALVQECLAQEIEALLRAVGDQDLGGIDLQTPPGIPLEIISRKGRYPSVVLYWRAASPHSQSTL